MLAFVIIARVSYTAKSHILSQESKISIDYQHTPQLPTVDSLDYH